MYNCRCMYTCIHLYDQEIWPFIFEALCSEVIDHTWHPSFDANPPWSDAYARGDSMKKGGQPLWIDERDWDVFKIMQFTLHFYGPNMAKPSNIKVNCVVDIMCSIYLECIMWMIMICVCIYILYMYIYTHTHTPIINWIIFASQPYLPHVSPWIWQTWVVEVMENCREATVCTMRSMGFLSISPWKSGCWDQRWWLHQESLHYIRPRSQVRFKGGQAEVGMGTCYEKQRVWWCENHLGTGGFTMFHP